MMPVTNMARDLKMERLERQAARDDPRANFELGDLYMYGHEPTNEDMDESADLEPPRKNIDLAKAATYFNKAAELGLADGHFQMALCHARNYNATEYWKRLVPSFHSFFLNVASNSTNFLVCIRHPPY